MIRARCRRAVARCRGDAEGWPTGCRRLVRTGHGPYGYFVPHLNKVATALLGGRAGEPGSRSPLSRLRIALTVFFALDGFMFAGWVVRIPAIKQQTGASASDLGLALLGVSAGAVVTMVFTGRLCRRFGSHPVTVVCAVLLSLSIVLPPQTHSALTLGLVLLVFGAAYGGLNVAMNSAAVDLVAALRRPVISSFHAAFSLGGMMGAGLGGLVAGGLSPTVHLSLLTGVGLLVTAVTGPTLLRHPAPVPERTERELAEEGTTAAPRRLDGRTRRLVLLFGVIALCTAYGEGAMADWSALHLTQDLDATPGLAAAGYSLFALAMTAGRLSGTALLERLGQTRALVAGGVTAALGMLVGALAPTAWLALAASPWPVSASPISSPWPSAARGRWRGPAGSPPPPPWDTAGCCWGRPRSAFSPTGSRSPSR